jgi:ubiquitin-like protein 4
VLHYRSEFADREDDVSRAFEDFFCASKGTLTASEIAKIRDELGVIGMAGI